MLLQYNKKEIRARIDLPGSKSISNRLLILKEVMGWKEELKDLSEAKDTQLLIQAISKIKKKEELIDIGDAGTDMRFLTALLSITEGEWILTGSERMKERPIGELVNALRQLGSEISYDGKNGFPPLKIKGKKLNGGKVEMDGSTSSQFITALLLISPALSKGIEIELKGNVVSWPYIIMTLDLLSEMGMKVSTQSNIISTKLTKSSIQHSTFNTQHLIEADWSSASYWFSIAALAPKAEIILKGLNEKTSQGDVVVMDIYSELGVKSEFKNGELHLTKIPVTSKKFEYDFVNCPDLAQTIAVTCFALGIECKLSGLSTLKVKETDRILALKNELEKLGAKVKCTDSELEIAASSASNFNPETSNFKLQTYKDHRMALSFAPLALLYDSIEIEDPNVVEKSYPDYWKDLDLAGISWR
jgi:3-phosphoshikimate 1-carboxyvinyltransferase